MIKPPIENKTKYIVEEPQDPWAPVRMLIGLGIMVGSLYLGVMMMEDAAVPEPEIPDGFEYAGSLASSHFLLMDTVYESKRGIQRSAARILCKELGIPDRCEVYIFKDRRDIPGTFPIRRDLETRLGYYKKMGTDEHFRMLHDGKPAKLMIEEGE